MLTGTAKDCQCMMNVSKDVKDGAVGVGERRP